MKRLVAWCSSVLAVVAVLFVGAGCTEQQMEMVAQQAGVSAVAAWYYSSPSMPSTELKAAAGDVLSLVRSKVTLVSQGQSYNQVLYPVAVEYISKYVPENQRLGCSLAIGWVLTGIDTMMAMHPEWAANQQTASKIVVAFCNGAFQGLGLPQNSPIIKAVEHGIRFKSLTYGAAKADAAPAEKPLQTPLFVEIWRRK